MTWQSIITSDTLWLVIGSIAVYFANSVVSRKWVERLPPTSPWRRAIRTLHGFLNRIDPMVIIVGLSLTLAVACVPRQKIAAPSTVELLNLAVNSTDYALALAIEANPTKNWDKEVAAVKIAATAVNSRKEVCEAMPALQLVASQIECDKCFEAVATVKEVLVCPQ